MRCVGKRIDALVLAFRLEVSSAIADEVEERQGLADEAGAAELRLGEFTFALKSTRTPSLVRFENADIRGKFDRHAVGGFGLELTVRAVFLATHSLGRPWPCACGLLANLGP